MTTRYEAGRAGRYRGPRCMLLSLLVLGLVACKPEALAPRVEPAAVPPVAPPRESAPEAPIEVVFEAVSPVTGFDFVHQNGMTGAWSPREIMGPGAALLDYDNDGDLDLYLVQGEASGDGVVGSDRLYRNDLGAPGSGLAFVDVTEESGLDVTRGYGMGVATGDINRDGWVDLYLTNAGANQLLLNDGDGTFTDITSAAGVGDSRWSVVALFFDYDRDGWLDLYVGNYLKATDAVCQSATGVRDYCAPSVFPAAADRLYRNLGDGRFEDATRGSGLSTRSGPALGAVAADFDGDGWLDLYIANDGKPNQLWMNRQDGTFDDRALLSGCSLNAEGRAEASMGVDAGDYDGDGDLDLFLAHLDTETNTLYRNDGRGHFEDRTTHAGLGAVSRAMTGFGAVFIDYDSDGWLDLFVANGDVRTRGDLVRKGDPFPFHQPNQLFRNYRASYQDVSARSGPALALSEVSRGVAVGDVDNDGAPDLLIANTNGPARLLMNRLQDRGHWIGLRLVSALGHDVNGATAVIETGSGKTLWRHAHTAGSYASARDPRILVGLGAEAIVARVTVFWPNGSSDDWVDLNVDEYSTLAMGAGR